jgi:hypothetical protein
MQAEQVGSHAPAKNQSSANQRPGQLRESTTGWGQGGWSTGTRLLSAISGPDLRAMTAFLKHGKQLTPGPHGEVGFAAVKAEAAGRWPAILSALGVPVESLSRRAGPCPGCGGSDRFRFDDREGTGSWFCNGAGDPHYGDGFELLGHALGMSKGEALRAVGAHLGIQNTAAVADARAAREQRQQREIEEALIHELLILLQIIQTRISSRKLAADSRFRVLCPEWMPMPEGHWERELLAVKRIRRGLERLYDD